MRCGVSAVDGQCHAFTAVAAARAAEHGYAVALCTHAIADRIIAAEQPSGAICMGCAALVAPPAPR